MTMNSAPSMNPEEVDVDGIQQKLGCGRFQFLTFLFLGLIYSRGAWQVFGIMFLAGDPGHKCALPDLAEETSNSLVQTHYAGSQRESTDGYFLKTAISAHHLNSTESELKVPEIDIGSKMLYAFQGDNMLSTGGYWTADTCDVSYTTSNGSSVKLYSDCPHGWSYGSAFETTVLSEWNLVCDQNYMVELSITVFMFGATVGAIAIPPLADRLGRKNLMLSCLFIQAVIGSVTASVNNYIAFTLLRFMVGMLNIGVGLSSFVLVTETFPARHRTVVSIAFQIFWAIGIMTVAGFGSLVRNWRHLELLLSLPNLLALPCYWLLPESLPWLISRKRWADVHNTIKKIAKVNEKKDVDTSLFVPACVFCTSYNSSPASSLISSNSQKSNIQTANYLELESQGKAENVDETEKNVACGAAVVGEPSDSEVPDNVEVVNNQTLMENAAESNQSSQVHAIMELFRNRRMRLYSCVMFFLFFVNSLGYFGISFSVPVLHGNPFVNLCIIGAVEIPADIICIIVSQRLGRRYPNAVFLLLCGISNIVALFTPDSLVMLKLGFVMLGKFSITAAYSTVYLYSAEIFPTAIRNQAIGISSVFENIGSISAPLIVHAAKSLPQLPLVVFGVLSVVGSGLTLLLPETHNRPLPRTVQETTTWGS